MADFDTLVRLYFAGMGVERIKTRTGEAETHLAEISGLVPYMAWRTLVCSKILTGSEPLLGEFYVNEQMRTVSQRGGIAVLDSEACLKGLAWALYEYENGDLTGLDDEITELVAENDGNLSVQRLVNEFLIQGYDYALSLWYEAKATSKEAEHTNDSGLSNV